MKRFKVKWRSKRFVALTSALLLVCVWYYLALPDTLFHDPYSTVLEASDGSLLSASIAGDGQWRFPEGDTVHHKFATALVAFEDKRFFNHVGFDPIAIGKALQQNIRSGKVVRGGSTITMQLIRLSRKGQPRTVLEKLYELILATRVELRYSKQEILQLYAAHAPFGGNVVGLNAACWRYFGRSEKQLSWAEASLLAVLPNSPSMIHPGKNREALSRKRNALLDRLKELGAIDELTCALSKEEPIPQEPLSLPRHARHLLVRAQKEGRAGTVIRTTIDHQLQERVEDLLSTYHERYKGNQIHNGCAIVADVVTGSVLAYVGNVSSDRREGSEVDVVTAPRSTGSILKPFLYAASLDDGLILPQTLLPDIPAYLNGFTPRNFSHAYDGAVSAGDALIRSLNIPSVFLLRDYRYERFHHLMKKAGMTTLTRTPDHYGLSIILGGAEGSLWDVAGMYASMARTANEYFERPGKNKYSKSDFHPLTYTRVEEEEAPVLEESSYFSAGAIYQTFDVLKELYRPGEQSGWRHFQSSRNIAWKTGTSFGFRDAWAVGVTPRYVVGVWFGNADGEGRPGLTGVEVAAPPMFSIFSQLSDYTWFRQPTTELTQVAVCRQSGMRSTADCGQVDTLFVTSGGLTSGQCQYHQRIHLSSDGNYRVNSSCADLTKTRSTSWFILPAVQEYYYRSKVLSYKPAPPLKSGCLGAAEVRSMDLVYPKSGARIFIPREISGAKGSAVLQLAHRNPDATVFWYLNDEYLGSTRTTHQMAVSPPAGKQKLLIIDDAGNSLEDHFEILSGL